MDESSQKKAIILIVDDDSSNLKILHTYFEKSDFHVVAAKNGKEALEKAPTLLPDLILLDVMMPGINGFETCRRLKANETTKDIPIIFMTGLTEPKTKVKGFEIGGLDYIAKPFYYQEVIARVNVQLALRKLQHQLQHQNKQLQALNTSKDQFLSIIANDLKKPFAEIFVSAEQITQQLDSHRHEDAKQTVKHLQSAVENYQALLENLLLWAKVQQGIIDYAPKPIDLAHMFVKNVALLTPYAIEKQITLTNLLPERLLITADITMLDTIIHNLLSNAIKFTKAGGNVEVVAASDDQSVIVSIKDTGIGIPAEKLPALFQIDQKYQQIGTADEKGTGLGLILCKEFVERHGGRIWVESEIKQGSTVHFRLPKQGT